MIRVVVVGFGGVGPKAKIHGIMVGGVCGAWGPDLEGEVYWLRWEELHDLVINYLLDLCFSCLLLMMMVLLWYLLELKRSLMIM